MALSALPLGPEGPLYRVEPVNEKAEGWRVTGPNGLVAVFETERDAQAKADSLNEQVAEGEEDDY